MSAASWLRTVSSEVGVADRGDGRRHRSPTEAIGGRIVESELLGAFVPDPRDIMTT